MAEPTDPPNTQVKKKSLLHEANHMQYLLAAIVTIFLQVSILYILGNAH